MNKKNIRRQIIEVDESNVNEKSVELLHNIHKKLDDSPALNGGFDKLLYKIDGIEKSQIQIVEKVDMIHEAIYHPDDGLFARIAANKATQVESTNRVEKNVDDIMAWKKEAEIVGETCEKEADELQLKIQKIESSIENIEKFNETTTATIKWTLAAVGGAILTVLFKLFLNAVKFLP